MMELNTKLCHDLSVLISDEKLGIELLVYNLRLYLQLTGKLLANHNRVAMSCQGFSESVSYSSLSNCLIMS